MTPMRLLVIFILLAAGIYTLTHPVQYQYVAHLYRYACSQTRKDVVNKLKDTDMSRYQTLAQFAWMRAQVETDLASHADLSAQTLDDVFHAIDMPHNRTMRMKVFNNRIYIKRASQGDAGLYLGHPIRKKFAKRAREMMYFLNNMCQAGLLPDMDLVMVCDDYLVKKPNRAMNLPVLTFAKDTTDPHEKNMILIVDQENLMFTEKKLPALLQKFGDPKQFSTKKNQIMFRGGPYDVTGFRKRINAYARDKDFIDAYMIQNESDQHHYVSQDVQLGYKYNLSIDGATATWTRIVWILATNTLLLKHQSPHIQWFYGAMKPGVHYVNVPDDVNALPELYRTLEKNPRKTQKILEAGMKFAADNLKNIDMYGYMYVLFQEYAKKQGGKTPPPDRTYVSFAWPFSG